MTDVLIAGAGPAGAVAAFVLARAGANVIMLDRATFPRDKLCGDTVNPGALAILRRLGLADTTAGGLPVDGMIVTGEGGVRVTGRYGGGKRGVAITRRVLDDRMVKAAVQAGARLEEGMVVQAPVIGADGNTVTGLEAVAPSGTRHRYTAAVTIAADGRSSRLGGILNLTRTPASPRRWAVGAVFDGVNGLSSFGEMHVRGSRYVGVAPLPGGLANACVVTADRVALRRPDLLTTTLRGEPETAKRFAASQVVSSQSILGPLALDAAAAGCSGLLLAGDAAGFIDPMTGDGLRFAFRGGELAAREALRVLSEGWEDAHLRLARARSQEFGAKWRFNRTLRSLAASPASVRMAGAGAALAPGVLQRMIRYAGDVGLA